MANKCHFKNRLITQPLSPGQHDFCLRSAATNERLHHFCNVAKAVPKYSAFWFEVTVNMIWSNFQTFALFPLFLEKILKLNLPGKKKTSKTFLLYFISFSVIYSLHGFFESRARRANFPNVLFHNFSLFPYISMFSAHLVAYLSSLLELPRRGRTVHDHQGRQSASSSFSSFLFLTW